MQQVLEGLKVVTSQEMARIEKKSIDEGASAEEYMMQAAEGIAVYFIRYMEERQAGTKVNLLIGKGNNGGDAYAVGAILLKKGYDVKAFCCFSNKECGSLNQKQHQRFLEEGGQVILCTSAREFQPYTHAPIIDGLLGTGFAGQTEGVLKELIDTANSSSLPIFAIDIPSGLDGNSGRAQGSVIVAQVTYYLGLPKIGFFLRDGYEKVGVLQRVDFGMQQQYIDAAHSLGFLLAEEHMPTLLPKVHRTRHKYQRGYVIALAGSKGMPGAALLTCLATLRAGAGIVRLFHPEGMEEVLSSSFEELIKTPWSTTNDHALFKEAERAGSAVIGPGLGKIQEVQEEVIKLLSRIKIPCVIDADALEVFAKHITTYPPSVVLTPHRQELLRCLDSTRDVTEEELFVLSQKFAEQKKVTIVLKGAPSYIFHPQTPLLIVPRGDPGMATAGSGDVLAGMIGAFLAQGLGAREAAALGVYLHALAGEKAAMEKTSYSVIASDLIEALPEIFHQIQEYKNHL